VPQCRRCRSKGARAQRGIVKVLQANGESTADGEEALLSLDSKFLRGGSGPLAASLSVSVLCQAGRQLEIYRDKLRCELTSRHFVRPA
jgi:hypothetical protein